MKNSPSRSWYDRRARIILLWRLGWRERQKQWREYLADGWWGWPLWLGLGIGLGPALLTMATLSTGTGIVLTTGGSFLTFIAIANLRRTVQGRWFWIITPGDAAPDVTDPAHDGVAWYRLWTILQAVASACIILFYLSSIYLIASGNLS